VRAVVAASALFTEELRGVARCTKSQTGLQDTVLLIERMFRSIWWLTCTGQQGCTRSITWKAVIGLLGGCMRRSLILNFDPDIHAPSKALDQLGVSSVTELRCG
jgi:hypothetical protein